MCNTSCRQSGPEGGWLEIFGQSCNATYGRARIAGRLRAVARLSGGRSHHRADERQVGTGRRPTCEEENWQERERQTEIDVQIIERRMDPIEDRVVSKAAIDAESASPPARGSKGAMDELRFDPPIRLNRDVPISLPHQITTRP